MCHPKDCLIFFLIIFQDTFCLNCQIGGFHMEHYKHTKHLDFYVTAVITTFVLET